MPGECLSDGISGLVSGLANGRLGRGVFKRFKPFKRG